jgi:periplasmic protein CpxP/Spy
MKRILLAEPLALVLSGALAFAQTATQPSTQPDSSAAPASKPYHQGRHHGHNPQREAAMLSKRLNLTSDQQAKLEPILADRDQKISALKSDTSLTPDQKKAQFKAIHQNMKQQLSTILTPDQLQQLQSFRHHGRHSQSQPQPLPQSAPPSGA